MKNFFTSQILLLLTFVGIPFSYASADDNFWYSYYSPDSPLSEFGTGLQESYDCAVYFPGEYGGAAGKTILKVRFQVQAVDMAENVKVWLSTSLPSSVSDADAGIYDVSPEDLKEGEYVEISLADPFAIPKQGVYVGFSMDSKDPFPILTSDAQSTETGGFYLRTSKTYKDWKDLSQYKYGNLALQILLDGNVYYNAADIAPVPEVAGLIGQKIQLPVTVINRGLEPVSSVEYLLQTDGGEIMNVYYEFPNPIKEMLQTQVIPVQFICGESAGISYKSFEITKVNGKDNEWNHGSQKTGAVISLEKSMARSTVMEEYTGTWCGWCPRGAVGIEALSKDFGPGFIAIAVHGNDPMQIPDYQPLLDEVTGFPSCRLNRAVSADPFFGSDHGPGNETSYGIFSDVEHQQEMIVAASAGVSSEWIDGEPLSLKVTSQCSLGYPREDNPIYNVAYVVCADGLKGDTGKWFQKNDFGLTMAEGYKDDPYLGWLCSKGSLIVEYVYNDVAIAAAGIVNGFALDYDGSWEKDRFYDCGEYVFDLSENTLVQNKDNLSVVVMLIDQVSGEIVNAVKAPVGDSRVSDVDSMGYESDGDEILAIYDMAGILRGSVSPGMNIILYKSGKTRKLFVTQ